MSEESLEQQVIKANLAYAAGKPTISDEEYDILVSKLPETSKLREYLGPRGTATVEHSPKMLSLEKTKTPEEAVAWMQTTALRLDVNALVMPKYDGVACRLIYVKGSLVGAYTRGDGLVGEDILSVVVHLKSVPKKSPFSKIDGELVIRKDDFAKLTKTTTYMMARSAVIGLVSRTDTTAAAQAGVVFIAYSVHATKQQKAPDSLFARLQLLAEAGFHTPLVAHQGKLSTIQAGTLTTVREMAQSCPYDTDGIVIRIDSMSKFKSLGATDHHPHGAVAMKHPNENVWTEVIKTIWQVGRSGVLTPVLEVKPVTVEGAEVRRSTLHSMKQFLSMSPKEGCQVELKRSGGVIPHIVSIKNGGNAKIPSICPSCEGELQNDETSLFCVNAMNDVELCKDACVSSFLHFVDTVGLDGIGPVLAESFIAAGVLHGPDIYRAAKVDGMFERMFGSVTGIKLRKEIDAKRELPLSTIIEACGIDAIGTTHAKTIALGAPNTDNAEELLTYFDSMVWSESFGPGYKIKMREGYQRRRKIFRKGLKNIKVKVRAARGGAFLGKGFCFTGELDIPRERAMEFVEMYGGVGQSGVSKKTHYLVCADSDTQTTKYKAAVKLQAANHPIQIVNGDDFRRMLKDAAAQSG